MHNFILQNLTLKIAVSEWQHKNYLHPWNFVCVCVCVCVCAAPPSYEEYIQGRMRMKDEGAAQGETGEEEETLMWAPAYPVYNLSNQSK